MKNRTLRMLALVGVFVLLPLQAWATVCFKMTTFADVFVIEAVGTVGPFVSLVGELVGRCGPGTSAPISGTAHMRADGKAHFGLAMLSPAITAAGECPGGWVQGTVDPPNFNSGTGAIQNTSGGVVNVTFVPVSPCPPPLPQGPESAAGSGIGSGEQ